MACAGCGCESFLSTKSRFCVPCATPAAATKRWRDNKATEIAKRRKMRRLEHLRAPAGTPGQIQLAREAARAHLAMYLRRGKIVPQACACGSADARPRQGDFSRPLDVRWVCNPCENSTNQASAIDAQPPPMTAPDRASALLQIAALPESIRHELHELAARSAPIRLSPQSPLYTIALIQHATRGGHISSEG